MSLNIYSKAGADAAFATAGQGSLADSAIQSADYYSVTNTGNPLADAIGDGTDHFLSERFATIEAAQAVFPRATALTGQIDRAAIQRALDVSTHVIIPPGTYMFESNVNMISGRTLSGYGATVMPGVAWSGSTFFTHADLIDSVIVPQTQTRIIGLTIDADRRVATGIRWSEGASYGAAVDVRIVDALNFGYNIVDSSEISLARCTATGCGSGGSGDAGFKCNGTDLRLHDCSALDGTGNGFLIIATATTRGGNHSYTACRSERNSRHGFYGATNAPGNGPINVHLSGCVADTCGGVGTYSGFALHALNGVRVIGCVSLTNREHGFVFQDLAGGTIVGCKATGNIGSGLRIQGDFSRPEDAYTGVQDASIVGNILSGNGIGGSTSGAILIDCNCHDIVFTGNVVADNGNMSAVKMTSRALFTDSYNLTFSGNVFTNNSGGGVVNSTPEVRIYGDNMTGLPAATRTLSVPATTPRAAETGTWLDAITTPQAPFYGRCTNAPGAVGDSLAWDVALAAGTYKVALTYRSDPAGGIVSVKLGGATVATFDLYEAPGANRRTTQSGITVSTAGGPMRLSLEITGKGASSTGYTALLGGIEMVRTGA